MLVMMMMVSMVMPPNYIDGSYCAAYNNYCYNDYDDYKNNNDDNNDDNNYDSYASSSTLQTK